MDRSSEDHKILRHIEEYCDKCEQGGNCLIRYLEKWTECGGIISLIFNVEKGE